MSDDRPPAPYYPPPRSWPNRRPADPFVDACFRVLMLCASLAMIVAGIVAPSAGTAVFGLIWLPFAAWAFAKPLLNRRADAEPPKAG
jgi:hypothetical protein